MRYSASWLAANSHFMLNFVRIRFGIDSSRVLREGRETLSLLPPPPRFLLIRLNPSHSFHHPVSPVLWFGLSRRAAALPPAIFPTPRVTSSLVHCETELSIPQPFPPLVRLTLVSNFFPRENFSGLHVRERGQLYHGGY